MDKFKIGDIVKCNIDSGFWDYITNGKLYEVIEVYTIGENNPKSIRKRQGVRIICDNGHKRVFNVNRFIFDHKATRDKNIDELLT